MATRSTQSQWCAPWQADGDNVYDSHGERAAKVTGRTDMDAEDRAWLIAAAPELLSACRIALTAYQLAGQDKPSNSTALALRKAIAKATDGMDKILKGGG